MCLEQPLLRYHRSFVLGFMSYKTNSYYMVSFITTKIVMGRRTKNKISKSEFGVVTTIVYSRKLQKNQNNKTRSAKNQILVPGVGYAWDVTSRQDITGLNNKIK